MPSSSFSTTTSWSIVPLFFTVNVTLPAGAVGGDTAIVIAPGQALRVANDNLHRRPARACRRPDRDPSPACCGRGRRRRRALRATPAHAETRRECESRPDDQKPSHLMLLRSGCLAHPTTVNFRNTTAWRAGQRTRIRRASAITCLRMRQKESFDSREMAHELAVLSADREAAQGGAPWQLAGLMG